MRTGAHAKVESAAAYEAILRERFAGVPEAWIPEIAKQVWGWERGGGGREQGGAG